MKLLSPQQTTDLKAQELQRELLRTQEIQKMTDSIRKDLALAESDFNESMVRIREQWIKEEETHNVRKAEMKAEIDALEARKNTLTLEDGEYTDIAEFLAQLRQKEDNIEELTEKLQDKLDKVGQKEQDVLNRERQIFLREQGVEQQKKIIVESSKKLTEKMISFTKTENS